MENLVLTLHILACVLLILLVLLQAGKEGMGVIFGGGSGSVFGSTGAGGLLAKLTAFLAAIFLVTSLTYNVLISTPQQAPSLMEGIGVEAIQPSPDADGNMSSADTPPASSGAATTETQPTN